MFHESWISLVHLAVALCSSLRPPASGGNMTAWVSQNMTCALTQIRSVQHISSVTFLSNRVDIAACRQMTKITYFSATAYGHGCLSQWFQWHVCASIGCIWQSRFAARFAHQSVVEIRSLGLYRMCALTRVPCVQQNSRLLVMVLWWCCWANRFVRVCIFCSVSHFWFCGCALVIDRQ